MKRLFYLMCINLTAMINPDMHEWVLKQTNSDYHIVRSKILF